VERYGRFADFVDMASDEEQWRRLRMSETSGKSLGSEAWLDALEAQTGGALKPQKRGPKVSGN
jgi:putative transposase